MGLYKEGKVLNQGKLKRCGQKWWHLLRRTKCTIMDAFTAFLGMGYR